MSTIKSSSKSANDASSKEAKLENSDIEARLANAVKNETPDMLEDLISEIGAAEAVSVAAEKVNVTPEADATSDRTIAGSRDGARNASSKKPFARKTWFKALAGIAAVFVLFAGIRTMMSRQMEAFAVIGLDVNPGIELSINQDERVIATSAVNDEAKEILSDMKLDGSDINVACNAIIGAMLTNGYLTTDSNSVLVSVRANDTTQGRELEQKLSGNLNSYLENSEIAAAILGQVVEDDDELEAFAKDNDVSLGKAWLIRNLLASGNPKYTEESLLKLSTQELILLGQKKTVKKEDFYGEASTSKYIGAEKAKEVALKHAGIEAAQANRINAEFDCDDGVIVYEVDFTAGGYEYEYDIDAATGKIVTSHKERDGDVVNGNSSDYDYDDDDRDDDERYDKDDDDDRDDDDRYDKDDDDDRDDDDRYDKDDDDDDRDDDD